MSEGEGASKIIVWLKNGGREIYDDDYYTWEIMDGVLEFHDEHCKKEIIYALSNVHKVEIING